MAKAVISGYYGFKNFGDETILSVLVKHLKEKDIDITVFSGNPEYTSKEYNVNSVKSFDFKSVVSEIKNSDFLISGGGSLLQDTTSLKSAVYYLFIIALGILFNKKVIIFAQGIGPINNKFARLITKMLLKQCRLVTVRDEKSLKLLTSWGINAIKVCDPVFSLNIERKNVENLAGVQLRDFKTMNYNLLNKLAMLICSKFSKVELYSLQESYDTQLCKKFETLLHTIKADIQTEIVADNITERISRLEYFFAMRFHAILCAVKCGVKTCAINYDIKVEKLAQEAQIPMISTDANENFEEIYNQMLELNPENLIKYADSKHFDWSQFDNILIAAE